MNLRQIIRESINSVILDDIISEEIIKESGSARRNMRKIAPNNRRQTYQPKKNLQQKKQQNVIQNNQAAADKKRQNIVNKQQTAANREQRANAGRQERFNQWSNQWANKNLPQETPENTQQGGYGYTNSGFDNTENNTNTNNTQPNQQITPQPTQQPSADFSQYADELRRLVGNSGIDPKPVQNNQAAVQHIDILNHFVFDVIDRIDNGNIDSASSPAAGKGKNTWSNPYGKDKVDIARDAMRRSVNYLGNGAENIFGRGTNNPLKGVFNAGVNAYNNTNSAFTQLMNNREYANAYGNKQNVVPSGSLTDLMKIYPNLFSQYQQINQQNSNIFSATPNVGNCYTVLQNLHSAVANHQKTKTQQAQNGQNTQGGGTVQTPQGGQGQTPQGGTVTPGKGNTAPNGGETTPAAKTGGKVNTTKKTPIDDAVKKAATNPLDEDWDSTVGKLTTLQQECHNLSYQKNMNDDIKNLFTWNASFLENVVSASDNEDEEQLMNLLSVNNKDGDNLGTYSGIKKKYEEALKQYGKDSQEGGYLNTLYKVLTYSNVLRSQLTILKNNNR